MTDEIYEKAKKDLDAAREARKSSLEWKAYEAVRENAFKAQPKLFGWQLVGHTGNNLNETDVWKIGRETHLGLYGEKDDDLDDTYTNLRKD